MFPDNSPSDGSSELPMSNQPSRQGDVVEIDITDVNDSGEGVGRAGDRVVFVQLRECQLVLIDLTNGERSDIVGERRGDVVDT